MRTGRGTNHFFLVLVEIRLRFRNSLCIFPSVQQLDET